MESDPNGPPAKPTLSPTAMPLTDAAALLSRVGGELITVEMLEDDLEAGAPANADGTFNLVCYAAWLVKERARVD